MKNIFFIPLILAANISCAQAQSTIPEQVEADLTTGKLSISDALTHKPYLPYHSYSNFRKLIKKYAKQEKITLVTADEPGTRMTVTGKIMDKNNKPLGNALAYVYHTDSKGWYSDTAGHVTGMEGDRGHARLFGYFRTMNDGSFEFSTIHPQGYPNSTLPQHIHLEVFSANDESLLVTELLFDDDKRLTAAMRQSMRNEGAYIARNTAASGNELYSYEIKAR